MLSFANPLRIWGEKKLPESRSFSFLFPFNSSPVLNFFPRRVQPDEELLLTDISSTPPPEKKDPGEKKEGANQS